MFERRENVVIEHKTKNTTVTLKHIHRTVCDHYAMVIDDPLYTTEIPLSVTQVRALVFVLDDLNKAAREQELDCLICAQQNFDGG
jgi:hypothetical protein